MKPKPVLLKSEAYLLLHQSFREWLELLGYSALSIPGLAGTIRDFLLYQEQNNKSNLEQLAAGDANDFIKSMQTKTGERTGRLFTSGPAA